MGKLHRREVTTLLAIAVSLLAASAASARAPVTVAYGSGKVGSGSTKLLLDLYQPSKRAKHPRPFVVLVHGGGFKNGSRKDQNIARIAQALAAKGIVAASIDYRLLSSQPVPSKRVARLISALPNAPIGKAMAAALDDTLSAIDYLKSHARKLNIDPNRMGLAGGSAGAITVDTVGYALDDHGIKPPTGIRFVGSLWGGILANAPRSEGPQTAGQLERGEPALFAVHGDADPTVPVILDDQLVARAKRMHVREEYHRIPGGKHGFGGTGFFTRKVTGDQTSFSRLLAFAKRRLR
jgi:acetyl esterase/lipase